MRAVLLGALCALIAACGSAVKLRNPQTGETASCGPYWIDSLNDSQAQRESRCISDFQRQGFQRVTE